MIPVNFGYATWCECGWNLQPYEPSPPSTPSEKLYAKVGDVMGERLFQSVMRSDPLASGFTFTRLLAYAIAAVVHGVTLLFLAAGIFLIVWGWPHLFAIIMGAVLLLAAWFTRPRLGRFSRKKMASREGFPVLYKIADDVAAALGTSPVDGIIFSSEHNAAIGRIGLRWRKVMTIGIPLFAMLSDEERIAVIAHELGHTANGDTTRVVVTGSALDSLSLWHEVVLPKGVIMSGYGYAGLAMIPVNLALYALAGAIWLAIYCLVHLTFHDAQRNEYRADYLAAEVAGTDAKLGALTKFQLSHIYEYSVQRAATNSGRRVFEELEHQMKVMPRREIERARRIGMLERSRLRVTHPPTGRRIRFLESRHRGRAKVTITSEESAALARELATLHPRVEEIVMGEYVRGLYH